jgi:hypothetical protein
MIQEQNQDELEISPDSQFRPAGDSRKLCLHSTKIVEDLRRNACVSPDYVGKVRSLAEERQQILGVRLGLIARPNQVG